MTEQRCSQPQSPNCNTNSTLWFVSIGFPHENTLLWSLRIFFSAPFAQEKQTSKRLKPSIWKWSDGSKAAGMGSQPVLDHRWCTWDPGAVLRTQAGCSGSRYCTQDPGRVFRSRITQQSHSSVSVGSGFILIVREELGRAPSGTVGLEGKNFCLLKDRIIEPQNFHRNRLEKPSKTIKSNHSPALPRAPLTHVPKCHILRAVKCLQEWELHQYPGQLCQGWTIHFWQKALPRHPTKPLTCCAMAVNAWGAAAVPVGTGDASAVQGRDVGCWSSSHHHLS